MGEYRLGHPGGVVPVVLGGRVGGRPGDLRDRGDDALDAEPGELPLRGEAEVAALVGRERRPGEPIHPPGDLAPGVAGEPPRHGLAGVRVEGADGGRPQVDVHPERGRILWHGSLPTSLRRGCAYGTSTSLSQPRPAVTSGGSYLFSALGLGHSVCRCQNIGAAVAGAWGWHLGVALGDAPFVPALWDAPCHWCKAACLHCAKRRMSLSGGAYCWPIVWAYNGY